MDYGRAVRTVRASKRMTQRDLAKRIDVAQGYLSLLESNQRAPSMDTLESIARALGVPMYLIVLLASGKEELGKVPHHLADGLGQHLLNLLTEAPDNAKRDQK